MEKDKTKKQLLDELKGLRQRISELELLKNEHKHLEELMESRAKYEAVVEAYDGLIYICSEDHKIEFMNKRFIEGIGSNPIGKNCYKVIYNLDNVCPWCVDQKVFRGKTVSWEVLSPRDNRWYYVINAPIHHPDGRVSKMAMIQDINERKQAQEEFKKRTEHVLSYQKALIELTKMDNSNLDSALSKITEMAAKKLQAERVSVLLFNQDRSGIARGDIYIRSRDSHEKGLKFSSGQLSRYLQILEKSCAIVADDVKVNSSTREFLEDYFKPLGISSVVDVPIWFHRKIAGVICYERIGPKMIWRLEEQDFAVSLAEIVSLALEASETKRSEKALQEAHTTLEMRVQRRTIELVKTNVELQTEISERKRIGDTLKKSENKYRAIFENTGTAMAIVEKDMTLPMVNMEFAKLSGYSKEEIEDKKSYLEFIADSEVKRIKEYHSLRRVEPEAAPRNYEFKFKNRYGKEKQVFVTVALIPETEASVVSLLDVTEWKSLEARLRKPNSKTIDSVSKSGIV